MMANHVLQFRYSCLFFTVDIIIYETSQQKNVGMMCGKRRSHVIRKMRLVICRSVAFSDSNGSAERSVWERCSILHQMVTWKMSFMLLKFLDWNFDVTYHIIVSFSCDGTVLDSIYSYLFKKIQSNDKTIRKTTFKLALF